MDVRMPDGTIIRNVPEGTSKDELLRKLRRHNLARSNPGEYDSSSPEWQAKYGATSGNGFLRNSLEGIGQGMVSLGRKAGNLVGLASDESVADAKRLDAPLMATGGGKVGSFLGETALVALPTLGVGAGLQAGGRALQGASNGIRALSTAGRVAANPITRGVAEGAFQGSVTADPGSRGDGALIGGALGGAIPLAGAGIKKVAAGLSRTPEAQRLMDAGVSLTPGQMNPRGVMNKLEQELQSAPIIGQNIQNARGDAMLDYNRAVFNRAVAPGAPLPTAPTISEMASQVDSGFGQAYSAFKGFPMTKQIVNAGQNEPLETAVRKAVANKGIFADDAQRRSVSGYVENKLTALGKKFDSADILKVRSDLRAEKRAAQVAGDTSVANLFAAAEKKITAVIESQLPKPALKALRDTDAQYRRFMTPLNATAKAKDNAYFTPTQHAQAIKEGVSNRLFALGGGDGRDLSSAARQVFDVKAPPTGARIPTLLGIGAGLVAKPWLAAPALASAYGLAATRTGRNLAAGVTPAQKALNDMLQRLEQQRLAALASQGSQRALVGYGVRE